MKKILKNSLIVLIFVFAVVFAGCKKDEGPKHTYTSYFHMEKCEECGEVGTLESERRYDNEVVYRYTDSDYQKFQSDYQKIVAEINKVGKYDAATDVFVKDSEAYKAEAKFEEDYYNVFDEDCNYIVEQYQYATIREDMDTKSEEAERNMDVISDYYNEAIEKYYSLFKPIYDSKYRNYFFSEEGGWTEDEIQQVLYESETYSNPEYVQIKNENDALEQRLDNIDDIKSSEVLDIYETFFANNKRLAELEGSENYAEQSYKYVYEREYKPEDILAKVNKFRELGVAYAAFSKKLPRYSLKTNERKIVLAFTKESPLENQLANDYVYNFVKTMKHEKDDFKLDFEAELENIFKTGAFFKGDYQGAYSWVVGRNDVPIMFFGPGNYSSSFTFIHEFGHHNNSALNRNNEYLVDSMDLNETHSQGNEMMLLNYLMEQDVIDNIKKQVILDEVVNLIQIIVLAAAVDIFEQAIYTNQYSLLNASTILADGKITKNEYDSLFNGILSSFGCGQVFNADYWKYVCLHSPCYYISYSISALESLQIFFEYQKNGYEAAQEKYYKLFDYVTLKDKDMTYIDVLRYAGIATYEDDQLYDDVINFMKNFA